MSPQRNEKKSRATLGGATGPLRALMARLREPPNTKGWDSGIDGIQELSAGVDILAVSESVYKREAVPVEAEDKSRLWRCTDNARVKHALFRHLDHLSPSEACQYST